MCGGNGFLSTGTISGRNGWRRLEHSRSLASQTSASAAATSGPYLRFRPRLLSILDRPIFCSNRMAALRCMPVTWINSSSIFPFSSFGPRKYLARTAWAYSKILRRVTVTSITFFGNTNFDATTTFSVTLIMIQCGGLTNPQLTVIISSFN